MNLSVVFKDFCDELKKREGFLSEDNIRFYWFSCMLRQDFDLNHYSLEEPYISISGKELDLMYEGDNEIFAVEIKFHRHTSPEEFPHPNSAGSMFDDIQRLPKWSKSSNKKVRRLFLYVTDDEMHQYLSNPTTKRNSKYRAELKKFYDASVGSIGCLTFDSVGCDTPRSFYDNACESCSGNVVSGKLVFNNIELLDKQNALSCNSASLQSPACWVRLYEIF